MREGSEGLPRGLGPGRSAALAVATYMVVAVEAAIADAVVVAAGVTGVT